MIPIFERFFFTYGREGQPYVGGWTEVVAPNIQAACTLFRIFHPDKTPGLLNCASVYTEEQFAATEMMGQEGNFGQFCHETIVITCITRT